RGQAQLLAAVRCREVRKDQVGNDQLIAGGKVRRHRYCQGVRVGRVRCRGADLTGRAPAEGERGDGVVPIQIESGGDVDADVGDRVDRARSVRDGDRVGGGGWIADVERLVGP